MDVKLRLLLRQFAATQDPEIAVEFARSMLRTDAANPEVWMVSMVEAPGDGNSYPRQALFYSKEAAERRAIRWIQMWIEDNDLPRWLDLYDEIRPLFIKGDLGSAIREFNDGWMRGYEINVDSVSFEEDSVINHGNDTLEALLTWPDGDELEEFDDENIIIS